MCAGLYPAGMCWFKLQTGISWEYYSVASKSINQIPQAVEAPAYDELSAENKQWSLFTDRSCKITAGIRRWWAATWNPSTGEAATCKGAGGSTQFAEVMALKIALEHIQEHRWPQYMYI